MKPSASEATKIRLQVFLSHSGVCSRRRALTLIQEGHVTVNGKTVTEPSTQVGPHHDKIFVDGKEIKAKAYEYILFNKPSGYVTTKAEHPGEKTIFDILPEKFKHLFPVGRLDKDTEGLLLLTNDGEVAYQLTHPKFNVDKIYFVCINGVLTPAQKVKLENGVAIEGDVTSSAKIKDVRSNGQQTEFSMIIHEGKKRQIRLMLNALRHKVVYLKRIQQGPLQLGHLKCGIWRYLTVAEIESIKK